MSVASTAWMSCDSVGIQARPSPASVCAGDHGLDLRVRLGGAGVDRDDPRVRVRAAQHRAVQHPGQRDVVDVAAAAADEPGVLLAPHRAEAHGRGRATYVLVIRRLVMPAASRRRALDLGGRADRADDVLVAGAPADLPGDRLADLAPPTGPGSRSSSQRAVIIIPGVQNPHCRPWQSMNPCCTGSSSRRARQPLDGAHLAPVGHHGEHRARLDRHAVEPHHAHAAVGGVAAPVRAGQAAARRAGSAPAAAAARRRGCTRRR